MRNILIFDSKISIVAITVQAVETAANKNNLKQNRRYSFQELYLVSLKHKAEETSKRMPSSGI
jgi:hypothetical protein